MAAEATDPIERWTAKRRVALVVSILKGETSVAEAARTHGLTVAEIEDLNSITRWTKHFYPDSAKRLPISRGGG